MNPETITRWRLKIRHALRLDRIPPLARKVVVSLAGGFVLLLGIVMLVTPGPAFIFIPAGLVIFACEFKWPETMIKRLSDRFQKKTAP